MISKKNISQGIAVVLAALLSGCSVGPDYHRPSIPVPTAYKEARTKDWSRACPADLFHRGKWWKVFHSRALNALENQLNISNQTIQVAAAQYQQALALVDEARAAYFPTIAASFSTIRQGTSGGFTSNNPNFNSNLNSISGASATTSSGSTVSFGGGSGPSASTTNQFGLNASWAPDIWGSVRRTVEASAASAQSSKALLAGARLSAQASLAQYYFELRGVNSDQFMLRKTVKADKIALQLTRNLYHQGVDSMVNVVQAKQQLEDDQATLINLGVTRAQYEHAIAVLIGKAPAYFSFAFNPFFGKPPTIPPQLPSQLLERRPDIASAERLMAQANAQIGVAIAAYFPTLSFTPSATVTSINNWFTKPLYAWSIGPQLAETLFDGGLRSATVRAARANYDATVAQYRQTVLAAFQNVEDNLASIRVLKNQAVVQDQAAKDAETALHLTMNQFHEGTASYLNVVTAQLVAYTAEKSAVDVTTLRMTSTVGLIAALGGGWKFDPQINLDREPRT